MKYNGRRCLTALVLLLMGAAIGMVLTYTAVQKHGAASVGAQKYEEIMGLVDQFFIGEDVDPETVNDAMAAGVISGLGDRWSYYVSAKDYQAYLENINNSYVGVGITISAKNDDAGNLLGYEINAVTSGSPAEEAGLEPGDLLVRAAGQSVAEISLEETKQLVKGEEGTTVELTILRNDAEMVFAVERRALTVVPAEGRMLSGDVGYITIDNFDYGCAETVQMLIEDLRRQGAESLLFDVRNNPGGLKTELTNLLDYLLPEGTIFHTVNYAGQEDVITSDEGCVDMPMAVLVNGNSYSAAEYFACALQEYGVGVVVGEHTFGKGYYQVGMQLSDGSCINLSIGKYFTPNGESLIDVGVTPDVELELSEEQAVALARSQLGPEDDPQIQAALAALTK